MSEGHSMEVDGSAQLEAVPQSDALIDGFTVPEVHLHCSVHTEGALEWEACFIHGIMCD